MLSADYEKFRKFEGAHIASTPDFEPNLGLFVAHHWLSNPLATASFWTKQYLLPLFFCLSTLCTHAQTKIPDQNFAAAIRTACPTCIDATNTILPPATTLTSLNVNNKNISNLSGIEGFTNLQTIKCDSNKLTSLPILPNSLTNLWCNSNKLTTLPILPNSLSNLYCFGNQLTTLPVLPNSLQYLHCHGNQLTILPTLPNSLTVLACSNNQLTTLPTQPNSLIGLYCDKNQLTTLPALPNNLQSLFCHNNQLTTLPALPNSLQYLYCFSNHLTILPTLPNSLQYVECSNNQLTTLPALLNSLLALYCRNNKLTTLPTLPNSLKELYCHLNSIKCLPTLPLTLQEIYFDADKITCFPNTVSGLKTYNGQRIAIPTPAVCTIPCNATNTCGIVGKPTYHTSESEALLLNGCSDCDLLNVTRTLQWRKQGDNWTTVEVAAINAGGEMRLRNLAANSTFEFRVKINCSNGLSSEFSPIVSFVTKCSPPAYGWWNKTDNNPAQIRIGWYNVTGIDGYKVRWRLKGTNDWTEGLIVPNDIKQKNLNYVINGLISETQYDYQMNSVCGGKDTDFTSTESFTTDKCVSTNPPPTATLTGTQTVNAGQTANLSVVLTGTGPWEIIINNKSYTATASPYIIPVSPTATTTYTLTSVKINCNTGTVNGQAIVTVNQCSNLPTVGISTGGKFLVCVGNILKLTGSVSGGSGGYSYQWKKDGTAIGGNSTNLDVSDAGQYMLTATDNKGCAGNSGVVSITKSSPTATLTGQNFFCTGTNTTLTATAQNTTGTLQYQWKQDGKNVGDGKSTWAVLQAGSYTAEITDANGCKATSSATTVTEKGSDIVSIVKPDGPITVYAPNTAALSATLGYEKDARFKYQWRKDGKDIAGATHYVHYAATSGNYAATISDADCAVTSAEVKVSVLVPTAVSLNATDELLIYPNPTDGLVIVSAHLQKMSNLAVRLIDLQGRIVETFELSKHINSEHGIDLRGYSSGTYILEVVGKELMKRMKIVKN